MSVPTTVHFYTDDGTMVNAIPSTGGDTLSYISDEDRMKIAIETAMMAIDFTIKRGAMKKFDWDYLVAFDKKFTKEEVAAIYLSKGEDNV